jgi:deazaflavin-dependent oxidoreductase (nitroreductase family)
LLFGKKEQAMTEEIKVQPPHPIPYPENPIVRTLYRTPILLYRLGLGKVIGKYIMIISTFGRKSGKVRRTPIEYFRKGDLIYAISGFERDPDWYRNLKTDPHVTLQTNQGAQYMIARTPETEAEWQGALDYLAKSPVPTLVIPEVVSRLDDPEIQRQIREWPVVVFEPTGENCPKALEVDLLWTWPLILILLAVKITFAWLASKDK